MRKDLASFLRWKSYITKGLLVVLLFISIGYISQAQNTVGLLSIDQTKTFEGYNLLYPLGQPNVYLLNNCGQIVHQWQDSEEFLPGKTAYILQDGKLIKTKEHVSHAGDTIWAPGSGAFIEIRNWDNEILWEFELNNSRYRLHHDIAVMPNGNILAVAWHRKSPQEAYQWGRDTTTLVDGDLYSEYIFEINPESGQIVWEWYAWDHMIQDRDDNLPNYGIVGDAPGRIDINYDTRGGKASWLHINAIDYSEDLDQILLSVPGFNEIWIIDHSTTTEEAAGSTGGRLGVGGDIAYRWGNPAAYRQGSIEDQKLFFQHDVQWVDDFVDGSFEHFGKIALFNNRIGSNYSAAHLIVSPFDMYKWQYIKDGTTWGPLDYDKTITHPDTTRLYSNILSSVQLLPNNNWMICSGRSGYSFELDIQNNIVWEYKTPFKSGEVVTQGDILQPNDNFTFRMERYPKNYPAFAQRDMSPKGYIELEPNEDFCKIVNTLEQPISPVRIYPNPVTDGLLRITRRGQNVGRVELFDVMGRQLLDQELQRGTTQLDLSVWSPGVYFLSINHTTMHKIILQ